MNPYAYRTTGLAIRTLSALLKARLHIHGKSNIKDADGSLIFVINHFTRLETLIMPTLIYDITRIPVWSLADYNFFKGPLGNFLEKVGAVSTRNPDRDILIVKTLLTGAANWIIFPEGRMVKSRKIIERGKFMVSYGTGKRPPHTGAASLAIRTEFYRKRFRYTIDNFPKEAERLKQRFRIDYLEPLLNRKTYIVPVNLTYYPLRGRENMLSQMAERFVEGVSDRVIEELMTEGTMLLSGVDIDICFGSAIEVGDNLDHAKILKDIRSAEEIHFNDPIPSIPAMRKKAIRLMQVYMEQIYRMTTVNHDHLFASMLKTLPFRKTDTKELRRKVYCTVQAPEVKQLHVHQSLNQDQAPLLAGDRFDKFEDFLSVAKDKGVVSQDGDHLVKDPKKFSSIFDFHRIRIDNPIAVIANEVEPLTELQKRIRRIAWTPEWIIRRRIVGYLLNRAQIEFEDDYQSFLIPGESKPKSVGMPFLLKGRNRKTGILLIHGYMAAPLEIRELALYLNSKGYWVYGVRLKGHGTSPEDLATRTWQDWRLSVEQGYGIITNICSNVVVGGFSTGAGLALELATRVPDLAGVFAISPPLRLQDLASKFVPALHVWNRMMEKVHLEGARMEYVENRPENPHINYHRNPISGVREIERLMVHVEDKLGSIRIPAFVAQASGDPVVKPAGSKRIYEGIGSKDKLYNLFNFHRHGILLGEGASLVHQAVYQFLKGHLKS